MAVTVNGLGLEGAVVQCLTDWAAAYPQELVLFKEQMARLRHSLVDERGFSRDTRSLRQVGEYPVTLDKMMKARFHRMWARDRQVATYFWKHFQVGHVWVGHAGRAKRDDG